MIRPLTLICVMLFLFTGYYDYQITHRADQVDQQIAETRAAAADARGDAKLLQTEWSWLNRPDRLQPFAVQFTSLQQVTPAQYVPLDQLTRHLPEPGSAPLPPTTLAAAETAPAKPTVTVPAAPVVVAAASPAPVKLVLEPTVATPAPHPAPPVQLAEAKPVITAAVKPAAPVIAQNSSLERKPAASALAVATPTALASAQPIAPKPVRPAAAPVRLAARITPAYRPPALVYSPRVTASPVMVAENDTARPAASPRSLSSLGMAQAAPPLPAPVAVTDTAWRNDQ